MQRLHRSRYRRDGSASARSPRAGYRHPTPARPPRERARDDATIHSVSGRTTAPALPATHTGRSVATSRFRALLDHEFSGVDLTLSLDVHHDSTAAGVVVESTRCRFCVGNWHSIDLENDIAGLNTKLICHAGRNRLDESTVDAPDISFRADRRCKRHELNLAKHGHLWRIHFGKIRDF